MRISDYSSDVCSSDLEKMPYIKENNRSWRKTEAEVDSCGPGELNFQLTSLIYDYCQRSNQDYRAINDIVGALEGAKLEFYRRVAAPYEDEKMLYIGDVYV